MDSLQYKVLEFEMPADDFDPNFTPENGMQYLQQVVYERKHCPAVVVRPLTGQTMPAPTWSNLTPVKVSVIYSLALDPHNRPDFTPTQTDTVNRTAANRSPHQQPEPAATTNADIHRPTAEWRHIQYAEFAQLREQISQLREQFARRAAAAAPATQVPLPPIDDGPAWRRFMQENRPLLSTMLRLDQADLEAVLDYQLEWLVNGDEDEDEDAAGDADADAAIAVVSWDLAGLAAFGRWAYSVLGCLHLPLEPSVHSALRAIAKHALRIRNTLDAGDEGAEMAAPLNLLVCIIAKCFGQTDLMERV